jgi:UDP-2,3-diacylglucosamine hydrolase
MAGLDYGIVDVNPASVETALRGAQTDVLLHGHTHRPGVHRLKVDGRECTRIVLGAWYDQRSVLAWNRDGFELREMPD